MGAAHDKGKGFHYEKETQSHADHRSCSHRFYASVSSDRLFLYTVRPGCNERRSQVCCPISVAPVRLRSLWTRYFQPRLKGTSTTFFVAFATLLLGGTIGVLVGAFTGYFGGWIDEILMRINDVIVSFPGILLALVFIALLGPGKYNVILALGIVFIPSFARITRSEFLARKDMDYVKVPV